METIRRPDAFAAALARAADAGKPVVCLKVGRSQAAARAALAHSGAVVGSARAFSALLRHHGAIEVGDFHELLETLEVLGRRRWPRGLRIAAVSESGGECGLLADHGEEAAIPFAPFDSALQARLVEAFPNFTQPENPLDCWAIDAYEHVFPGTLSILRETGSYDVLLAQLDLSRHRGAHEEGWCAFVTAALADTVEGTDIFPAVTSVHATDPPPAIAELARDRDVALLRGTREGLWAIAAVARWNARPRRLAPPRTSPWRATPCPPARWPSTTRARCSSAMACAFRSRALHDARRGGRGLRARRRAGRREAGRAGPQAGRGRGRARRRQRGEARAAAARLGGRVLVAHQVPAGVEAFCGLTRDADYGPVLAVGLGGRAIEALGLAAVALAPLDEDAARAPRGRGAGARAAREPGCRRRARGRARRALAPRGRPARGRRGRHQPADPRRDGATAVDALVVVKGAP